MHASNISICTYPYVIYGYVNFFPQGLHDEIVKSETKHHLLIAEQDIFAFKQQQASDEIKLYLSNDPQDKKKSLRYVLIKLKIFHTYPYPIDKVRTLFSLYCHNWS